jgi:hypothetical protein
MRIKRKREITFETSEALIIKTRANQVRCRECGGSMMTVQAAVAATGASSREIHRRIEAGALHFEETEGWLLVCPNSLTTGATEQDREAVAFFRKEITP